MLWVLATYRGWLACHQRDDQELRSTPVRAVPPLTRALSSSRQSWVLGTGSVNSPHQKNQVINHIQGPSSEVSWELQEKGPKTGLETRLQHKPKVYTGDWVRGKTKPELGGCFWTHRHRWHCSAQPGRFITQLEEA